MFSTNDHYYALSDAEYEKFKSLIEAKGINHPELIEMKLNSWQRIFDLSLIPDPLTWSAQGVVWEVALDRVKKMDYFIAR
ncbi:MAG: hypothetical protein Q4G42_03320 [Neisseria sp.]|nr:hypothetical protein [Neisseria sp.]